MRSMSHDVYTPAGNLFSDAPHAPNDHDKVVSLVEAYQAGSPVTPVVFITYQDYPSKAVSGSHRLAAMAHVFETLESAADAGYVLTVESNEEIDEIFRERGDDFEMAVWLMRQLPLPTDILAALEDQ
jgi:hypothetical protein